MSFNLFFQTSQFTTETVEKTNPLTGESASVRPSEPLNDSQLTTVRQLLESATPNGPSDDGCYVIELEDGGNAEVFTENLESGCMVALHGLTPCLLDFLFDLLNAVNWAMIPATETTAAITTSAANVSNAPDDFPRVIEISSAQELGVLLNDGVWAWEQFRDQRLGGE